MPRVRVERQLTIISNGAGEKHLVLEQLLHILFGTLIFAVIGLVGAGLDVIASRLPSWGVSGFTHNVLTWVAHILMILDVVLFLIYLIRSGWALLKEMFR